MPATRSRKILALSASVLFSFLFTTVHAQIRLDLPSQPLSQSLTAVGTLGHLNVMFDPSSVEGMQAPALKADLSADDALGRLLQGTKLRAVRVDANTIRVVAAGPLPQHTASSRGSHVNGGYTPTTMRVADAAEEPESTGDQHSAYDASGAQKLSEVLVTGTYLRDTEPLTSVITLTGKQLQLQGYTRLDQAIEQLPQNFKAGASPLSSADNGYGGAAANANYNFASSINLRGLGPSATLILLNGVRLAPTALGGATDVSTIPLSAIDRIEILLDGASAIYGSDAIGGVVNIITKPQVIGIETGVRSSSISSGKAPDYGAYALGGANWDGGGILANYNYEDDKPLLAINRSFTETAPNPTTLYPARIQSDFFLSGHQELGRVKVSSDAFYSTRRYSDDILTPGQTLSHTFGSVDQAAINTKLDYLLTSDWHIGFIGQFSRETDANNIQYVSYAEQIDSHYKYQVSSVESRADGSIIELPGGPLKGAIGLSERWESFGNTQVTQSAVGANAIPALNSSRSTTSAYVELLAPIVGRADRVPLVNSLAFDAAVRYDRYSDFGSTTNPKVALKWALTPTLTITGSVSRSFRAPTLYLVDPYAINNAYIVGNSQNPLSPQGTERALVIDGTNANLKPETARTKSFGITYAPDSLPGLKSNISYFDVRYRDRIDRLLTEGNFFLGFYGQQAVLGSFYRANPSLAQVQSELAVPGRSVFSYVGPYSPQDINALLYLGYENAATTTVRGLDSTLHFELDTSLGRVSLDNSASYYLDYVQKITDTAPASLQTGLLYMPARLRDKINAGLGVSSLFANLRLNYTGGGHNPNDSACSGTIGCQISSWTTIDTDVTYVGPSDGHALLSGVRLTVALVNVLNRIPPYAYNASHINYDPVNTDPLGRTVSVSLSKRW